MKRSSLKDVNVLLKIHNNYCIRVNEITRQIHLVRFDLGCVDEMIVYIVLSKIIVDLNVKVKELKKIIDFIDRKENK